MEMESNASDSDCIRMQGKSFKGSMKKNPFGKDVNLNMKKVSASRVFVGIVTVQQTVLRHILKSHSKGY